MNRAALVVILMARTAAAAPAPMVTPPAGWIEDPEQSAKVTRTLEGLDQFGGKPATVVGKLFVAPGSQAALAVTRATLTDLTDLPASARAAIDELLDGPRRAAKTSHEVTVVSTAELQDNPRQYAAVITWRDATADLTNTSRLVLEANAEHLVAVTGECLTSSVTRPALLQACTLALQRLDSGIPPDRRVEMTVTGRGPAAAVPAPATPQPRMTSPPSRTEEPARLTDGTNVVLPPMAIPANPPEADRRPLYIGGGLVVMAVALWWNRRRRERFDRDDATARGDAAPAEPSSGDDDGDDLHAAARGEASKDE